MDNFKNALIDFYGKNKELSIALAGALVGIIGTWIFNNLGPWIASLIRSVFDLVGKAIGGHFAYAGIKRKYLNWVVLQNQDLNLTGIIATGEKPKLEQVFISLNVVDENKEPTKDNAQDDTQNKAWFRYFAEISGLVWGSFFKIIQSKDKSSSENASTGIFSRKPMWRIYQFFSRTAVLNLFVWLIVIIVLIVLPIYGLFGTPNINNWLAGVGASIWSLLIALFISLFIEVPPVGAYAWALYITIIGIPLSGLVYSVKERVIDNDQSPLAISIGVLVAIIIVIFFVVALKTSSSDKKIIAKEVGQLLDLSDCIAILGKPGSGKSTYAQFIALTFAQDKAGQPKLRKRHIARTRFGCKKWYFPILIPLRKVRGIKDNQTSQNLLLEAFRQNVLPSGVRDNLPIEFLRYMLQKKNCLVIFDGLDEVANDDEFQVVVKEIQGLVSEFSGNKFIVTSRDSGWRGGVGSDFLKTEIRDLDTDQINYFIENWYEAIENNRKHVLSKDEARDEKWFRGNRAVEKADSLKQVLEEVTSIRNLAQNPLLLSMICYIHYSKQLPKERLSLYEDCNKLLLEQWDVEKGYPQDDVPLKLIQKDLIMQEIAYAMHCGKIGSGKEAKSSEIIPLIRQMLERFGMDFSEAEALFHKLISRTGVIVVTEKYKDMYGFSHLTFQEFYTAKYLHTNGMDIFQVIKNIDSQEAKNLTGWWREVILLYNGMMKDTSSMIVDLCNIQKEDFLKKELQIAAQCFAESVEIPNPEVERVLFTKLYSIRSIGNTISKENLSNVSVKKYLLGFATSNKYYEYVLENIIVGIKDGLQATSAEESLIGLIQSADRDIQIAASKALIELWGKYSNELNPRKEVITKILEITDFPVILKTIRVVQITPELIGDKEFVDEYIVN
jgi:hypothetical protein